MKNKLSKDQRRKKKVAGRKSSKTKDHCIKGTLKGSSPVDWLRDISAVINRD